MECPQGLEDAKEDKCMKLLHTIYGLVQLARQFWKKLVNGLKEMGFKGGYHNPCLMWRKNDLGMTFVALYVDDLLYIRDKYAIASLGKEFVNAGFQVKPPEELNDYLSCNINIDKEEHEHYRTGVSILLYLVKNTQPNIANTVKELTRLNDVPTGNATREIKRIIKYVIVTRNKGLKITPQKKEKYSYFCIQWQ